MFRDGWAPGAASVQIHASCLGGTPGHPEAWAGPQLLEAIVMLDLCRALNGTTTTRPSDASNPSETAVLRAALDCGGDL